MITAVWEAVASTIHSHTVALAALPLAVAWVWMAASTSKSCWVADVGEGSDRKDSDSERLLTGCETQVLSLSLSCSMQTATRQLTRDQRELAGTTRIFATPFTDVSWSPRHQVEHRLTCGLCYPCPSCPLHRAPSLRLLQSDTSKLLTYLAKHTSTLFQHTDNSVCKMHR